MKKIIPLLFLVISTSFQSQKDFTIEIKKYVQTYNNRDIVEYVNLLIPTEYGGKEEYKNYLVTAYTKILGSDERRLSQVKIIHSVRNKDHTQFLFSADHGNSPTFFIGSTDAQSNLKFSTLFNSNMRIDQITEKIPGLDRSFYDLIEPGWENVVRFKVGEKIPDLKWKSISGKELNFSEMSDQVIVLNFWHTTCPPCIKEIPELNELVNKFPEVNFIAPISDIDVDYLKNRFLAKHDFKYDIALVNGKNYNVYSFPKHILIKGSKVLDIINGYSADNITKLETAIKAAN